MHIAASRNVDDFSVLVRSTKAKSHAAHRVDERVCASPVHLPPQPTDIDVDDVGHRVEVQIPDVLQQHRAGNNLSGVANQIREQLKLFRQQLDLASPAADGPSEKVHLQVADPQERLLHHGRAAAGQRIDASEKLGKGEGLDEVVVAARPQASDTIIDFAERADDEGRRHNAIVTEAPNHLDAVEARQHAVDGHHDVVGAPAEGQPLLAVAGKIDRVAARSQAIHELLCRVGVVLDDEDSPSIAIHAWSLPLLEASPRPGAAETNIFVSKVHRFHLRPPALGQTVLSKGEPAMDSPRILAVGTAVPRTSFTQDELIDIFGYTDPGTRIYSDKAASSAGTSSWRAAGRGRTKTSISSQPASRRAASPWGCRPSTPVSPTGASILPG